MLAVNAAQVPTEAAPGVPGDAVPDGGFKGVLEQRLQSAADSTGGRGGSEVEAPVLPPEVPVVLQMVDSNRIASDAMAAFLALQPPPAVPPGIPLALPVDDAAPPGLARAALSLPVLPTADGIRVEAPDAGSDPSAGQFPAADLRAAMDAASGKRLPQASVDSPPSFRALMVDAGAARTGAEGVIPLQAGGPATPESASPVPLAAQAPAAPSPGEARAATTQVATPFGRPEWSNAMNERVTWLVGQRVQSADIQLNPPQLGPVEVRITIQNDQANLYFTSQNAAVREAIQAALPRLNEMLAQGGLSLGQTSVGAESFAGQQQASRDGNGGRRHEADLPGGSALQGSGASGPGVLAVVRGRVGIDMYV